MQEGIADEQDVFHVRAFAGRVWLVAHTEAH